VYIHFILCNVLLMDCVFFFQAADKPYRIHGSFLIVVERLDEEFMKILQHTDSHSMEFINK